LWEDKLPNRAQLKTLKQQLGTSAALPPHVLILLRSLPPSTQPMDAVRTAVSALAATDPDVESNEPDADRRKAIRITAQLPTIVTASHRLRNSQEPIAPDPSLSIASNFLYMMGGKKADDTLCRVL